MSKVKVLNWNKESSSELELPADIFEQPVRADILHAAVKWQLACRRQGTHQAKTRAEVSGGGKKPFKQKGTGNARQGSNRSPLMPGGAVLFGPRPRDYSFAFPKQMKRLALRCALSQAVKDGKFHVVESMDSQGKTKEIAQRLQNFGLTKALLIDGSVNENFKRATKNLSSYKYFSVDGLNVFDLLKYDNVVVTKESIAKIVNRCRAE